MTKLHTISDGDDEQINELFSRPSSLACLPIPLVLFLFSFVSLSSAIPT